MRSKKFSSGLKAGLAIFTTALFATSTWAASHKLLHSFGNGTDGVNPQAGLISDSAGNLYGPTEGGGIHQCGGGGCGTVFELSPREGGGWTEKVLHNFGNGADGTNPAGTLVIDAAGNLYGTTGWGGIHGAGTVFELSPNQDGGWAERVLHSFGAYRTDGTSPSGSLVFDAAGNLYGTTATGGIHNTCRWPTCGTVFELLPLQGGGWTEKILHSFGRPGDGAIPFTGLIFDTSGNLYGTTFYGGIRDSGTAFELSPAADGGWTEKVLHSFGHATDGAHPQAPLVFDAAGNLYGITQDGGIHGGCWDGYPGAGCGTVFELSPREDGSWTETVLHSFGNQSDGTTPNPSLIFDAAGNLYGTTNTGGVTIHYGCGGFGCGTVFELSPKEGGGWTEKVMHNFGAGRRPDGDYPNGNLVIDAAGNLYGMTSDGGIHWDGTVFEITP